MLVQRRLDQRLLRGVSTAVPTRQERFESVIGDGWISSRNAVQSPIERISASQSFQTFSRLDNPHQAAFFFARYNAAFWGRRSVMDCGKREKLTTILLGSCK